jgi:hypothetical protein
MYVYDLELIDNLIHPISFLISECMKLFTYVTSDIISPSHNNESVVRSFRILQTVL